jgi:hypothetical protein
MGGIKRSPADIAFSNAIRERADWTCEHCEEKGGQLQNSHFYGRRHRGLRFLPSNCACLCVNCHRFFTEDPAAHTYWFTQHVGEGMMEILREKKNSIYKMSKGELKEIAAFYRQECRLLKEARDNGETGRLEISSYY